MNDSPEGKAIDTAAISRRATSLSRTKSLLATALILFCAYRFDFPSYAGQVIDEETGKPLEGVIVMAHWTSSGIGFAHSNSSCYAFVTTQTDKNGNFSVPSFSWNFNPLRLERSMGLEFYLPGYEISPNDVPNADIRKLQKFKVTVEQRLTDFVRTSYRESCVPENDRKEKLAPLYKAQYREAKALATTPSEKKLAESLRAAQIEAEFGFGSYSKMLMDELKR